MDKIQFSAFVFQINLVNGFALLDNRGKIFNDILNYNNKVLENGDTLKSSSDKMEFALNSTTFIAKLHPHIINKIDTIENAITHIEKCNKEFIDKAKDICKIINVSELTRFASRFQVNYQQVDKKHIKAILNDNSKDTSNINIQKQISKDGLIMKAINSSNQNLQLDIDRYINTLRFKVNDIDEKYKIILENCYKNISDPTKLFNSYF